jgi:hypothetical protein
MPPHFNTWKFLYDLIHFGPKYFWRFKCNLKDLEVVYGIEAAKTYQVPLHTMDIKPSTPSQNGDIIMAMLSQPKIGDLLKNPQLWNMGNIILLISVICLLVSTSAA